MTHNSPHATPQSNATATASAPPCKLCGCTDDSSTPTTSPQADSPSFRFLTMEEYMARPVLKIALEFGLITLIIVFLHRHIGIEIEYFLWPITMGLGGAIIIQAYVLVRDNLREEQVRDKAYSAEKKEEKIKREAEEKKEKIKREAEEKEEQKIREEREAERFM